MADSPKPSSANLPERLRERAALYGQGPTARVLNDAADEIERLRGAARRCVNELRRADLSSALPWLVVLRARDDLREALDD